MQNLSQRRKKFYLSALAAFLLVLTGAGTFRRLVSELPPVSSLEEYTPSLTTRVYDVHGQPVAELFIERRAFLPLSKIPVDLQNAVIAVEDDQFFKHWGISIKGMVRSALRNTLRMAWGARAHGGSTITQQLSRGIFLTREKKFTRKIKEMLLALQIERNFSKTEILELYLNQIYFGHGAYGVQAAAKVYFGKEVSQLTLAECSLLAGLIQLPSTYSPFTNPEKARHRRAVVLARMREEGFVSAEEQKQALEEAIPQIRPPMVGNVAPYFVEYVRQTLEPKYGFNAVWKGGLKIYTTLDLNLQKAAETIMESHLSRFDQEAVRLNISTAAVIQGAFVALDARSGALRAMIGGRDFKLSQFNRAVQAKRQPGSTFKPFIWLASLMHHMTAATLVEDAPLAYYNDGRDWRLLEGATEAYSINLATTAFASNPNFQVWVPNNFDGKFLGVVTLRRALELSRNLVSVRLIERVGPPRVAELAHKAGIESRLEPVLSLGLGTSVVSPLEMANAFGTFANGGIHVEPFSLLRVEDSQGKLLEEHVPVEVEAISPQYCYLLSYLMKGVVERGTAKYARRLRRPIAGKTGTTQDNRDLWFVGFTPDLVSAAWMGYDDFSTLGYKDWTGGSTVVPWWTEVMEEFLKGYPSRDFAVPDGIVFLKVDSSTGKLALPTCPEQHLEAFLKGSEPKEFCEAEH